MGFDGRVMGFDGKVMGFDGTVMGFDGGNIWFNGRTMIFGNGPVNRLFNICLLLGHRFYYGYSSDQNRFCFLHYNWLDIIPLF